MINLNKIYDENNELLLEKIYDRKNNFFDFLRLFLALLVIYGHAFPLFYGKGRPDGLLILTKGQLFSGTLAVYGFFALSGFLVTQSITNSPTYSQYLKKRLLRIIPAFFVSLFFISFVIGPIISELTFSEYFNIGAENNPFKFFLENITFNVIGDSQGIYDVFKDNPFPYALNGSMWTLRHEFACYIVLMMASFFGALKHRKIFLTYTFLIGMLVILNLKYNYVIAHLNFWVLKEYIYFIKHLLLFNMGCLIYLYKDSIYFNWRIMILILTILIISVYLNCLEYYMVLFFPYFVILLGISIKFSPLKKIGDLSYGVYIYAWPIQQILLVLFKNRISFYTYVMLSYVVIVVISYFSWHYIEKPMIRLKYKTGSVLE